MATRPEVGRTGRQGSQRRGLADAGPAGNGTLPEAVPVTVGSEAELRCELERVVSLLAPSVEWTQRVDALRRLEGLIRGGAANFAAFPELLLGLRDVLAAQMQERRSAVSRQACHAVGILAVACGIGFEPLAVYLFPLIFRTLAMGIQIVSEAADACAHTVLAHCPSPRLLPKLCSTVSDDKNGRLRQSASDYLLRLLETWEPADYERQAEAIERAMMAAVQDAQGEIRAAGRNMFGAYAIACPGQAHALLARLATRDKQLQEKLAQAAQEYMPGMLLLAGPSLSQPASRRTSLGNSGAATPRGLPRTASLPAPGGSQLGGAVRPAYAVPKLALSGLNSAADSTRGSPTHLASSRSSATAATFSSAPAAAWQQPTTARENQSDNRAAAVQCTPRSMFPKTLARREAAAAADADSEPSRHLPAAVAGTERMAPRRSLGGAALRMSVAAFRRHQEPEDVIDEEAASEADAAAVGLWPQRAAAVAGALRAPLPPLHPPLTADSQQLHEPTSRPLTARRLGALERQPSSMPDDSEVSSVSSGWEDGASSAANLAPLLAGLSKAGVSWGERVALFQSLQAAMQQAGSSQHVALDVASNADRLVAVLLEGAGDAHFRVATAALAALAAGLASPSSRIFEPLLDRVMTALFARVVDPKEQIRQLSSTALSAVLQQHSADAIVAALARSLQANRAPRVKCAVMEYFAAAASGGADQQRAPLLQQLGGSALGGLLRSLLQLATDKSPDIRRAAAEAVASAYHGGEGQAVLTAVHSLPPADCLAVQRAIGPAIQQRAGEAAAAAPRHSSKAPNAPSQQPGNAASGRQTGEGPGQAAQQPQDSGSLTSRSGQSSQSESPGWQQQQQQAAVHAVAAAPRVQLTPEPPSPFMYRGQSPPPAIAQPAAAKPAERPPAATTAAAAAPPQAAWVPAVHAVPAPSEQRHAAAPTEQLGSLSLSELAPFDDVMAGQLQRLLGQLDQGPTCEALQGLSRLAHVLPAAAWLPCFDQVMTALCGALDSRSSVVQDAGLMLMRDLAAAAQPSLFLPALPALLPRLLACAAEQGAREVAVAADEALEQLLQRAPPQSCLGLLAPQLPAAGGRLSVDRQQGAVLHAAIRSLRRVVVRMQPAGLSAHLQPLLMPGLCMAYRSPLADVRKATVECLVAIWLVVGDAIKPHLQPLSASQMKLLVIYHDKARGIP